MFERRQDGTVRMTFKPPPGAPQVPPRLSFTYSSMITAVQTAQEDLPITRFNSEGYPVYPAKHNGHFLWDALGSGMCDPNCPCWDDWEEDDDFATTRKKKPKKKKPPVPCHHYDPKPPSDPPPPPAPLPIYQKELKWIAKHYKYEIPSPLPHPIPIVQPLACMMFSSTSSDYSSSFPPLEPHTDSQRNVVSKPFILSPITSTDHLEPPKPFESVLNWQTQNARAQNDTLLHLNSKVETSVCELNRLRQRYNGPEFDQKEREIRRLKAELAQIESEKQRPTLFTTSPPIPSIGPTYHPFASMLSLIKQYDPSKLFGMTHTPFRDNPLPPPPKPKPKPKPQPRPVKISQPPLTIPDPQSPGYMPASPSAPPPPQSQPLSRSKDKEPMNQFTAHTVTHSYTIDDQISNSNLAVLDSPIETDTESSASTSDSEKSYADITKILMAQPDPPTHGQTSHTEPYVDIPSEVEEEMPESSATNHPPPAKTNPSSQKSSNGPWFTFDDLLSHKWCDRLRQYRQLQFVDLPEVSSALAVLHDQFLGDPSAVFEAARRDYLNMKCCSLNAKDLDFHYKSNATRKRIAIAVQRKNGIFGNSKLQNFHPNLADPESPTGSSERNLPPPENSNESNQADVSSAREKAIMPKIVPTKEKNPSDEPNDEIVFTLQHSSDSDSDQSQVIFHQQSPWRALLFEHAGQLHLQHSSLLSENEDVESNFSEQSEQDNQTTFIIAESSDSDDISVISIIQIVHHVSTIPRPSLKMSVLPSKFHKPVPVIGFIDTGADTSMIDPSVLPSDCWEKHLKLF
ncbi:hypothetical protein KPL71_017501 [Citrus sinensis]|uniref:Uncharacterized protein n=2 Tax=Citrus sinensis TaxID=2711 RepID=A0ACB8JQQ3_CITSI|nr:hypothetical protein KPL71_017501 [Citrus sinensis]